jgi:hypothetical protein
MFAKEDGTCRQILVSQYATDSSPVAVMVPLVPGNRKAKSLVTKKCQAWFYLRLAAYSFFRLSEGA